MKYACNTCRARYAIPDGRVMAAGEQGLRIRCARCRAIMAVCFRDGDQPVSGAERPSGGGAFGDMRAERGGGRYPLGHYDEDVTQPLGLKRKKASGGASVDRMLQALPTEVGMAAAEAGPAPAALSSSGVYRPLPGVGRGVTGMHMPATGAATPGRGWYAAFGGRPRGPYSRVELELLAEQGKVRSSTLVWRPGFPSWRRVKGDGQPSDDELQWLRGIVETRKRRERSASNKAAREHGIHRLHLDDFSTPMKTPPPIPAVDAATLERRDADAPQMFFVGRSLPGRSSGLSSSSPWASRRSGHGAMTDFAADRVFGAPRLGGTALRDATLGEGERPLALAFTAGALVVGLGIALVTYTLPALGFSLSALVDAALALAR